MYYIAIFDVLIIDVLFIFQILLLCLVFVAWTLFIFEYGLLAMQRNINLVIGSNDIFT